MTPRRMDDEEFRSTLGKALTECTTFADELAIERARATDYYNGKPFNNEEEGRSQVVLTEVRDAVLGVLPSLIRVLLGSDYPVEFVPRRADQADQAAQATEYIRYVFAEDNPGFLNTVSVLKDGLVRRLGIFKWGWDTSRTTQAYRMEGLSEADLQSLASQKGVTITSATTDGNGTYDVDLTCEEQDGAARIWALPPEEFLWNREARDLATATIVAHRTEKTRSDLMAMGVKEADLDEYGGHSDSLAIRAGIEEVARRGDSAVTLDPELGTANQRMEYVEAYVRMDYDGDGIAELRKVCTIGNGYYPVLNVPWDEVPFSIFTPDPEPHTLLGHSWHDRLQDIQRIKSALARGLLDSLSASIFPRMTYEQGYASVADLLNTAIGAPIRITKPGAVQPFTHPFVGKEALPILDYFSDVVERRVGRNNGAGGLDADALQSTDKQGVIAAISGSQEQAEMLARIFAENTLKPLFKGLLKLYVKHRPQARLVRLRGQWVDVRPDAWNANMDVQVNVALGSGFTEKKIATLVATAAQQKEILTTYGPANPLVTVPMFRNTVAKILELQGVKDVDNYFAPLPPDWQPPPPPPPPPTPEQVIAQAQLEVEKLKVTGSITEKEAELGLKREQMQSDAAFKDRELRMKELESERKLLEGPHNAEIERYKADVTAQTKQDELVAEASIEEQKIALERERMALDLRIAELEAAAQVEAARVAPKPPAKPRKPKATV